MALFAAQPCLAQDAAESAVILSGTGERTGAAARSVGEATAGAINSAAGAINQTRRGGAASPARSAAGASGSASAGYSVGYTIAAGNVDPLEYFRVPTFKLGNGSELRVSGTLVPMAPTVCIRDCG
ncbi:hypothetical protein [Aurantiacibacter hainanensis]|uniref:hypothetical protein n=1 Tax=Aurantiacibacter hainanensis TaxID=3076114 RepID=UPI0030C6752A